MVLSQGDLQKVSEFLQQIYAVCTPEELMFRIAALAPTVVPSEMPIYSSIDHQANRVIHIASPQNAALSGRVIEHANVHPRFQHYLQTRDLRAYTVSDFWTERELHRQGGLYDLDWRPLGIEEHLSLSLPTLYAVDQPNKQQLICDGLSLHRSNRSFTDRDRLVLNLLLPHIVQAQQNSLIFAKMQQTLAQSNQVLEQAGAIILAINGQVKLMTMRARDLLTQYLSVPEKQLFHNQLPDLVQSWFRHQIALLNVDGDMPSPSFPLQIEQAGKRLTIRLVCDRVHEQHLLLLEEQTLPKLSIDTLKLIGLTQREAEVLFWVAKDKNNAEIGQIIGCSSNTVRKHLEHIFEKLGVQTRTAAVMAALERLGLFPA